MLPVCVNWTLITMLVSKRLQHGAKQSYSNHLNLVPRNSAKNVKHNSSSSKTMQAATQWLDITATFCGASAESRT